MANTSYCYSKLKLSDPAAWEIDAPLIAPTPEHRALKSRAAKAGNCVKRGVVAFIKFLDGPREL